MKGKRLIVKNCMLGIVKLERSKLNVKNSMLGKIKLEDTYKKE